MTVAEIDLSSACVVGGGDGTVAGAPTSTTATGCGTSRGPGLAVGVASEEPALVPRVSGPAGIDCAGVGGPWGRSRQATAVGLLTARDSRCGEYIRVDDRRESLRGQRMLGAVGDRQIVLDAGDQQVGRLDAKHHRKRRGRPHRLG